MLGFRCLVLELNYIQTNFSIYFMKIKQRIKKNLILAIVCFCSIVIFYSYNKISYAENNLSKIEDEGYVNVEIISKNLKEWSVSDYLHLDIKVELTGKIKDKSIATQEINLILPYGDKQFYGVPKSSTKNGSTEENGTGEEDSKTLSNNPPLLTKEHPSYIQSLDINSDWSPDYRQLLVIQQKPSQIVAQIKGSIIDGIIPFTAVSKPLNIEVKPAWYSIYFGGVIGALLLNILWLTFGLQNNSLVPDYTWKKSLGLLGTFVIRTFNSIFVTIAVILLSSVGEYTPFISFQIKDFLGGMGIGLFSYPLGMWIYKKLLSDQLLKNPENQYLAESLQFDLQNGLTLKLQDKRIIIVPVEIIQSSLNKSKEKVENYQLNEQKTEILWNENKLNKKISIYNFINGNWNKVEVSTPTSSSSSPIPPPS
jgi:hypothetical protein